MKYLLLLFVSSAFAFAQNADPAGQVADAERAFSAASEKFGIRQSFLQFLSDDCVMFNPGPVNGKELYRNRPENSAYLTWYPSFVEVSSSGELGISTGPWEYRRSRNDTDVSYGHFFSVWKKQNNGEWKVLVDNGIRYPQSEKRSEKEICRTMTSEKRSVNKQAGPKILKDLERSFSTMSAASGALRTYEKYSAENIRLYRKDRFPTSTKESALALLQHETMQRIFTPVDAVISSAGDYGYVYGYAVGQKNDSSAYIRVWRKDKEWKIAVDLREEFPK